MISEVQLKLYSLFTLSRARMSYEKYYKNYNKGATWIKLSAFDCLRLELIVFLYIMLIYLILVSDNGCTLDDISGYGTNTKAGKLIKHKQTSHVITFYDIS